ncbi:unnamed protein product [Amoebophrya sp. A120]|nr:unnamed protein product [Amoebophrya sp. A120]|eukprot:GSA120T00010581001.1
MSQASGYYHPHTQQQQDENAQRQAVIEKIMALQQNLSDVTLKIDAARQENLQLKEENDVLKDYVQQLVASVERPSGSAG